MSFVIPTFNTGTVEYNVILNGSVYYLRTYWNQYAKMWFLDLKDNNNDPIQMGIALVPNINLLRRNRNQTETIGELRVVDTNGDGNATTESLGNTSLLYYFLPGEFEATYPDYNKQDFREQQFDFDSLFTVVT